MTGLGRCATLLVLVAVTACSGDGPDASASSTRFEGRADSAFCRFSRSSAADPVEDPFVAGLSTGEVEERFVALRARFASLAERAPDALEADLDGLLDALDTLGDLLAEADYDFAGLAEADRSLFDDPAFATSAARISEYQSQVCDDGG